MHETQILDNNIGNNDENIHGGEEPPNPSDHVVICHHTPDDLHQTQTLSLSQNAADAHLAQHEFDTEGRCATTD